MTSRFKLSGLIAVAIAALGPITSYAQDVLEEVIVTAQKREQSLQDVGIAIDVFSGADLRDSGAVSMLDISKYSPGLNIRGPFGENSYPIITLRGVNTDGFIETLPQSTGVYADGVYLSQSPMLAFRLLDIKRIEVLKGPQGTLYGRNTIAGAVNFIANRPTFEPEGYVNLGYGRYQRSNLEAAYGGPLSDTVAFRVAVKYLKQTGSPLTNLYPTLGDGGKLDQLSGRASLLFVPNEDVELLVQFHAGRDDSDVWPFSIIPAGEDTNGDGIPDRLCNDFFVGNVEAAQVNCIARDPFVSGDTYNDQDGDPYSNNLDAIGQHRNRAKGAMAELKWDLGSVGLTSVTAWDTFTRRDQLDEDAGPTVAIDNVRSSDVWQFSQEVRLASDEDGPYTWLLGAYYSTDQLKGDPSFDSGGRRDYSTLDTQTYAIFGQVEYLLSDVLTAIAGGRYTLVDRNFEYRTNGFFSAPELHAGVKDGFSDSDWSGKLGLNWDVRDNTMLYASISKGFNAGTYNSQFLDVVADVKPTTSETMISYEIGVKSTFADGKARLEAATYYYDYSDMQVVAVVPRGTIDANILTNAKGANLYGFEAQLWALPSDWLDFNVGVSYIGSELDTLESPVPGTGTGSPYPWNAPLFGGTNIQLKGESLPNAPKWSLNSTTRLTFPVSDELNFVARVDVSWQDKIKRDLIDTKALYTRAHWNLDGRLSLQSSNGKWDVSLWGRNLTNETYITEAYQVAGFGFYIAGAAYNYPRTYGVSASYNF